MLCTSYSLSHTHTHKHNVSRGRYSETQGDMGSEAEAEEEQRATLVPTLPLLSSSTSSVLPPPSPERSGTATPPLQCSPAAVPFRWEDKPGKPKLSTAIIAVSTTGSSPKSLELPPRLIALDTPNILSGSNRFRSPSLRMGATDCYGSFSAERGRVGPVVRNRGGIGFGFWRRERGGWLGGWRWRRKKKRRREVSGGSHVFPSCSDVGGRDENMKRSGSFSSFNHSKYGVWATICEGFKRMVQWRSEKQKKDGYGLKL